MPNVGRNWSLGHNEWALSKLFSFISFFNFQLQKKKKITVWNPSNTKVNCVQITIDSYFQLFSNALEFPSESKTIQTHL